MPRVCPCPRKCPREDEFSSERSGYAPCFPILQIQSKTFILGMVGLFASPGFRMVANYLRFAENDILVLETTRVSVFFLVHSSERCTCLLFFFLPPDHSPILVCREHECVFNRPHGSTLRVKHHIATPLPSPLPVACGPKPTPRVGFTSYHMRRKYLAHFYKFFNSTFFSII